MHTVKKNWDRPNLFEFDDWLKDQAETHEKMNPSQEIRKPKRATHLLMSPTRKP